MKTNTMIALATSGLIGVRAEVGADDASRAGLIDVTAEGGGDDDAVLTAINALRASTEARFLALEEEANSSAVLRAARQLNGSGDSDGLTIDTDYTNAFATYARRGGGEVEATLKAANVTGDRAAIQAAMSEGDSSSGGYLAPVEWDRQVRKAMRHLSPMRRLSQVVVSGVSGYSTLWNSETWGSGWVGELAGRPATTSATLSPLTFPAGEIFAMPAATQRLLDDAQLNLDEWIGNELADEFGRQEGIAFVAGDGINKPMGFLQYLPGGAASAVILNPDGSVATPATAGAHPGGNLGITVSKSATEITADSLIDLKYGLGSPYRQNATFVMNSTTASIVAKMKDGQNRYIWQEALAADQPPTLLGRPVEIDENMPDIGAGRYPIAFGNFARGYLVNDRIGVRMLRDPYTAKPYVLFYATKRVGGGVLDPKAIRVLKVAAN